MWGMGSGTRQEDPGHSESHTRAIQPRQARGERRQRGPHAPSLRPLTLSPGGQNVLVKEIIEQFCPRFTPGGTPVYVGDTDEKFAYFDPELLRSLGVAVDSHGKMPDVVVYHNEKGWLVLIEAVTSHGPVDAKRRRELEALFKASNAGLVYVTAFLTRRAMVRYLDDISWETEVWVAESPTHLIHFVLCTSSTR
jgi:hypothetical protein